MLVNGSTAIDGLSGSGGAAGGLLILAPALSGWFHDTR